MAIMDIGKAAGDAARTSVEATGTNQMNAFFTSVLVLIAMVGVLMWQRLEDTNEGVRDLAMEMAQSNRTVQLRLDRLEDRHDTIAEEVSARTANRYTRDDAARDWALYQTRLDVMGDRIDRGDAADASLREDIRDLREEILSFLQDLRKRIDDTDQSEDN